MCDNTPVHACSYLGACVGGLMARSILIIMCIGMCIRGGDECRSSNGSAEGLLLLLTVQPPGTPHHDIILAC